MGESEEEELDSFTLGYIADLVIYRSSGRGGGKSMRNKAMLDEYEKYKWLRVGTVVDYHAIVGGPVTKAAMVVRERAQQLPSGQWVCWLRGKAGCVACESLTPVAP